MKPLHQSKLLAFDYGSAFTVVQHMVLLTPHDFILATVTPNDFIQHTIWVASVCL